MLEIVLSQTVGRRRPTVLVDTPGSLSGAAQALTAASASCTRLLYAAPPFTAPPETIRRWHRDLWNAMPDSDRRRVILVAGSTAQYLAPLLGEGARVIAFIGDPVEAAFEAGLKVRMLGILDEAVENGRRLPRSIGPLVNLQSRALLGPWHDLPDIPLSKGAPADADEWRTALLEDVLGRITAYPAEAAAEEAPRIAHDLKWFDKTVARYLDVPRRPRSDKVSPASKRQVAAFCWLDAELRERVLSAGRASR